MDLGGLVSAASEVGKAALEGVKDIGVQAVRSEFPSMFERPENAEAKPANLEGAKSEAPSASRAENPGMFEKAEDVNHNVVEEVKPSEFRDMTPEERSYYKDKLGDAMPSTSFEKCTINDKGELKLKCINEDKAGLPGEVPYTQKTVEVNGVKIHVVTPDFEGYKTKLPQDLYCASDSAQFTKATANLRADIVKNPSLVKDLKLSPLQVEAIMDGSPRIPGKVWHHGEIPGEMQLVDSKVHNPTVIPHTGGKAIWGGGKEYRR